MAFCRSILSLNRIFTFYSPCHITSHLYSRSRKMPPEFRKQYLPKVTNQELDAYRHSKLTDYPIKDSVEEWETNYTTPPGNISRLYQELLPSIVDPAYRNRLKEKLEREEMMKRRKVLNIPEFYAGSIMAATLADPFAPDKANRFVGICIVRTFRSLYSTFTLRNVVDKQAIEIEYELYNPTLQKIEVLKLERRLDDNLFYLRDAPQHYSTFNFNMLPVHHPKDAPVPINEEKVELLPPPWNMKWHLYDFQGIDKDSMYKHISDYELSKIEYRRDYLDRYDLMKMYRSGVPEAEKNAIMNHVYIEHQELIKFQEAKRRQELEKYKSGKDKLVAAMK